MEKVLFISDVNEESSLPKIALEVLNGAAQISKNLNAPLTVGLIGKENNPAVQSIANCGAEKFLSVQGSNFAFSRYFSDVIGLESLAKASGATLIIAPSTNRMMRALPGLTARLNGKIDTHLSEISVQEEAVNVRRWFYRQRMEGVFTRTERPWILLFDAGVFSAREMSGSAQMQQIEPAINENEIQTEVLGIESSETSTQTIKPDAKLLFVAGAGWSKKQSSGEVKLKDAEKLILTFLEKSGASLGSSKSLVDQSTEGEAVLSFMTHLNQIGQTGATPRHQKGLATCCHGEEPHVIGWRFINERRAINLDPNCGWAQGKADVLYVADVFEVMEKINSLLQ